jgi:hypothetical protein
MAEAEHGHFFDFPKRHSWLEGKVLGETQPSNGINYAEFRGRGNWLTKRLPITLEEQRANVQELLSESNKIKKEWTVNHSGLPIRISEYPSSQVVDVAPVISGEIPAAMAEIYTAHPQAS